MRPLKAKQIEDYKNKSCLLQGWVQQTKIQKNIVFMQLRDSTGTVQIVIDGSHKDFKKIIRLKRESIVQIVGTIKEATIKDPLITIQGAEIGLQEIKILNQVKEELPLQIIEGKGKADLSTKLNWRCISLRNKKAQAIIKVQSIIVQAMQEHLYKKGFQQIFTPCLMGIPSESGSEMFELNYFDKTAYLRQDPQLHRQLAIASGVTKLFDFGPVWRAEKSNTAKHLCEHRVCAVELAFIENEKDTMKVEEELVVAVVKKVNDSCQEELALLQVKIETPKTPFPVLEFPQIYDILEAQGKKIRGEDLDSEAEKILAKYVKERYNSDFYFINKFPYNIKPFYVAKNKENNTYANSVDLMFGAIELSSGGQREHTYEKLMQQVKEKGLDPTKVEWFTKFFRFGVPPHGGFAIGIERLTQSLLGIKNIREAVLFPRDPQRLLP